MVHAEGMTSTRPVQVGGGLLLAGLGLFLAFSPLTVAAALGLPHDTSSQAINLRATWGGSMLGLGAFVLWLRGLRPMRRALLGLLLWFMAGVGLARAVGLVLDGSPDRLQWVWMGAEVLIATACALALRRPGRTP